MIVIETAKDLLRLFGRRERIMAGLLVILMSVSGAFEILGMAFLFGFISALGGAQRAGFGPVGEIYQWIAGDFTGVNFVIVAGAVLVVVFAIKNALWLLTSFGLQRFAMKRYERVATRLFAGYQEMPLELMRSRGTSAPTLVMQSTLSVFLQSFMPLLQCAAEIAVLLSMLLALLLVVDPVFVLVSGGILGSVAVIFLATTRRLSAKLGLQEENARRAAMLVIRESLMGLTEIRLAGLQGQTTNRFRSAAATAALSIRRMRVLQLFPRALNELVLAAGIALAAAWFMAEGQSLGDVLPTLAVMGFAGLRVTAASARLMEQVQMMRQSAIIRRTMMAAIERAAPDLLLFGASAAKGESYRNDEMPLPEGSDGILHDRISLDRVTFRYPGADGPAIKGVSLEIEAGSFAAFCGPSGGGKSTLVLLTMGLLRPQSGTVTCDGWDVFRHIGTWHGQIGYVGQSPFISPRSIRENVAFGIPAELVDEAQVWAALEAAALVDFVREQPDGLDTPVGEDGALLSGGQRQRIAIARALYHDPAVLVFDEATAALDTATEREVAAAIARLRGKRTIIAIAHRLSTIEEADVIHYVSSGSIRASGTRDELTSSFVPFGELAS